MNIHVNVLYWMHYFMRSANYIFSLKIETPHTLARYNALFDLACRAFVNFFAELSIAVTNDETWFSETTLTLQGIFHYAD